MYDAKEKVRLQFSEYGKFPASKAKCGTSTLCSCVRLKQPVQLCACEARRRGEAMRRRGAQRRYQSSGRTHGFLMKVCLKDRGEQKKLRRKCEATCSGALQFRRGRGACACGLVGACSPRPCQNFFMILSGSGSSARQ